MTNSDYYGKIADALIDVLRGATSPEMMQAQLIVMRRMALSGDVVPSRVPAPQNITEVGGYLNFLETLDEPTLRAQVLASILGVAGPNPPQGWFPSMPLVYYASHANDRPGNGPAQAPIPVYFAMRADFLKSFADALEAIHRHGCTLPLLSTARNLPAAMGTEPPPSDLLAFIGRALDIVPSVALLDPDMDPLAVARRSSDSTGTEQVVARVLNEDAPDAATVSAEDWIAWKLDATTKVFVESEGIRRYLPVSPLLSGAGWYRPGPIDTAHLPVPPGWARFVNLTGLVSGITHYGEELSLLYSAEQIAASSLRERMAWVWTGDAFASS